MSDAKPLFHPGSIVITPGAEAAFKAEGASITALIERHVSGDWGEEIADEDRRFNNKGVNTGDRLLTAYTLPQTGTQLWVITERNRSATTIMLPAEY